MVGAWCALSIAMEPASAARTLAQVDMGPLVALMGSAAGVLAVGVGLWQVHIMLTERRRRTGAQPSSTEPAGPAIPSFTEAQIRAARRDLLSEVRRIWITDQLDRSLATSSRIELGVAERPEAVQPPLRAIVRHPLEPDTRLTSAADIASIFHRLGRRLLILGQPGAGKTTLMLELARALLDEAELPPPDGQPPAPVPVVFKLASWTTERPALVDWLAEELHRTYGVTPRLGRAWVASDEIMPLLDGLDEVPDLEACVTAINEFRVEHGQAPLVVCSRTEQYESLGTQLELRSAIMILPLDRQQVRRYLVDLGASTAGLRATLRHDPSVWELLTSPLFLSFMVLTYRGRSSTAIGGAGSGHAWRRRVLADYVASRLADAADHEGTRRYTMEETVGWLSWLARGMSAHSQRTFQLDWLQPDWLADRTQWRLVSVGSALAAGVVTVLFLRPALNAANSFPFGTFVGDPGPATWALGVTAITVSVCGLFLWLVQSLGRRAAVRLGLLLGGGICLELSPWFIPGVGPAPQRGLVMASAAIVVLVPWLLMLPARRRSQRLVLAMAAAPAVGLVPWIFQTVLPGVSPLQAGLALVTVVGAGATLWCLLGMAARPAWRTAAIMVALASASIGGLGHSNLAVLLQYPELFQSAALAMVVVAVASTLLLALDLDPFGRLHLALVLLTFLATIMVTHSLGPPVRLEGALVVAAIVGLAPWLPIALDGARWPKRLAVLTAVLLTGMTIWISTLSLSSAATYGIGLGGAAVVAVSTYGKQIIPTDQIRWSWRSLGRRLRGAVFWGVAAGVLLAVGIVLFEVIQYEYGWIDVLSVLPTVFVYGILFGLAGSIVLLLAGGLDTQLVVARTAPGGEIAVSGQNAVISALLTGVLGLGVGSLAGVAYTALGALGWFGFSPPGSLPDIAWNALRGALGAAASNWESLWLVVGTVAMLVVGMRSGGAAYVRHHTLLAVLARSGAIDSDCRAFLDHVARLVLLRRRGGGFEFVHGLLQEYFAGLGPHRVAPVPELTGGPATSAGSRPVVEPSSTAAD